MAKFIKCQASLRASSLSCHLQEDFEQAARGLGYWSGGPILSWLTSVAAHAISSCGCPKRELALYIVTYGACTVKPCYFGQSVLQSVTLAY